MFRERVKAFVARMPKPPTTGDANLDKDVLAKIGLLARVIQGVLEEPDAATTVHAEYELWVKTKANQFQDGAAASEQFKELTTIFKCDEEFSILQIIRHTDFTAEDMKKVVTVPGQLDEMQEAAFQLPPTLKMLPPLQIKNVMQRFLKNRGDALGNPLKKAKEKGLLSLQGHATPRLDWKCAPSYTPGFNTEAQCLVSIRFRNGDEVPASGFSSSTPVRFPWSDMRACFPNGDLPDVPLHLYFKKAKLGPYAPSAAVQIVGKCKAYADLAAQSQTEYATAKEEVSITSAVGAVASQVKQDRELKTAEDRRIKMQQAREKGAEALKRRRLSQEVRWEEAASIEDA